MIGQLLQQGALEAGDFHTVARDGSIPSPATSWLPFFALFDQGNPDRVIGNCGGLAR
jgi:hypothetical protein